MGKLFDDYRPELHYMRGPGPKWHAKHAGATTKARSELREPPQSFWLMPAAALAMLGLWRVSPQSANESRDAPGHDVAS